MDKLTELKKLYDRYINEFCNEQIVLGSGDPNSELVFIGEAPGRDEVKQGKPFVGAAGKILAEFFSDMNLGREQIYITNTIKYRLCKKSAKTGNLVNRPVRADDILKNKNYLYEELCLLKPKLIVTLGNVPLKALLGNSYNIGEVHGTLRQVFINKDNFLLFPLYHPASLIYNRSLKSVYTKDLNELKKVIGDLDQGNLDIGEDIREDIGNGSRRGQ